MKKTVLIGIFLSQNKFPFKKIRDVIEFFKISQIFVFEIKNENKFLLTFNLDKNDIAKLKQFKYKSIRLHRKKNGLLYTINAINEFEKQNKGVDLNKFNNCCLVVDKEKKISMLQLDLKRIIKLGEKT